MRVTSFLSIPALLASLGSAGYVLQDDYGSGASFFNKFSFFTGADPTHGFVQYVDSGTAQAAGLISSSNGTYIGVDHTNPAPAGRQSVRLTSTRSYTHGLVILDLAHMPGGICGTWPAFWMLGTDWPNNGEIDIIEGVNDQSANDMTLHTSAGCSINNGGLLGSVTTSNCDVNAPGQPTNAGCGITAQATNTYGTGFNDAGGGVYATEWTSQAISIWFFPHSAIPRDIASGNPDPTSWGTPLARFAGNCNIDSHFGPQQIVFDTTFCGDWAGPDFLSGGCASLGGSCTDYVANNPSAFADAYWQVNSLKVYQSGAQPSSAQSSSVQPSSVQPSSVQPSSVQSSSVQSSSVPPSSVPPSSVAVHATATVSIPRQRRTGVWHHPRHAGHEHGHGR